MNRHAPVARHARIDVEEILARVLLDPNGSHQLEVVVPSEVVGMRFNAAQVEQLEIACAAYRTAVTHADGGPDFYNPKAIPIEVKR